MSDIIFLFLRRLRAPLIILIVVYSVAMIGMTLIPGVDANGQPYRMSFFHAFYFVSFMGSTIGFGEVPYPFTDAQRLWVSICIYASVISWLYAIGNVLRLFQDASFQQAVASRAFDRAVERISQDFYIVCGYGDTAKLLTRGLADLNTLAVIVDLKPRTLGAIELSELSPMPITLVGDISKPEVLKSAGVSHPRCKGVIAITQDDHTNLKIAVAAKLINKSIKVICRSESEDEGKNMRSFGTDIIINPFETFARRIDLLTRDRAKHRLQSWFVNQHSEEQVNKEIAQNGLPTGRWIVCGYGRLGESLVSIIERNDIETVIIDPKVNPDDAAKSDNQAPHRKLIQARGTEAETLLQANIEDASVIVAATDDDANNLSILITAHALNPQIYSIGRVNDEAKHSLYRQANCDYIMRRSQLVSNEVLTVISRPLVNRFLERASYLDDDKVKNLITSIKEIAADQGAPVTWRLMIDPQNSPALMQILDEQHALTVGDVIDHIEPTGDENSGSVKEIALLLDSCDAPLNSSISSASRNRTYTELPSLDLPLKAGDQLLICHARGQMCKAQKMAQDYERVDSLIGGNHHTIPLLRWWHRRKRQRSLDILATD